MPPSKEDEFLNTNILGELKQQLNDLRDNARVSGDHVYVLPDGSEVWAHSLLIELVAPSLYSSSSTTETTKNGWGRAAAVIHVIQELVPVVHDVVQNAYTPRTLLRAQTEGSRDKFDYELHLRDDATSKSLASWHVPRFLLAARIPYFARLFSSGFGDSTADTGSLYTPTFDRRLVEMLVAMLFAPLPPFEHLAGSDEPIINFPACPGERSVPATRNSAVVLNLLDLSHAAKYLELETLPTWAFNVLNSQCHNLACEGAGCAAFLPFVWQALYEDPEAAEQWPEFLASFPRMFGLISAIKPRWKRRLLDLPDELLAQVIAQLRTNVHTIEQAVHLWRRLDAVDRLTSASPARERWMEQLIGPAQRIAISFAAAYPKPELVRIYLDARLADAPTVGEFLVRVAREGMTQQTCRNIYCMVNMYNKPPEVAGKVAPDDDSDDFTVSSRQQAVLDEARAEAKKWFRRHWLNLSIIPGFWGDWPLHTLRMLAKDMGVELQDLMGHTAMPKPSRRPDNRNPRRPR